MFNISDEKGIFRDANAEGSYLVSILFTIGYVHLRDRRRCFFCIEDVDLAKLSI